MFATIISSSSSSFQTRLSHPTRLKPRFPLSVHLDERFQSEKGNRVCDVHIYVCGGKRRIPVELPGSETRTLSVWDALHNTLFILSLMYACCVSVMHTRLYRMDTLKKIGISLWKSYHITKKHDFKKLYTRKTSSLSLQTSHLVSSFPFPNRKVRKVL
jgi:hypothetical protein